MAGRSRYPLEAARTLRAEEEAAAKEALAARLRELQAAGETVTRARDRLATHGEETAQVAERERKSDGAGRSVAETLRAGDWLRRRRAEADALAKAVNEAVRERAEAATATECARTMLADSRAAREAVEKHYAAWLSGEKHAAEAREEAEVEDLMANRLPR